MKKILTISILSLTISGVAFGKGWHHDDDDYYCNGGHSNYYKYELKQAMRNNPTIQKYRIQLQENKLALMKERSKPKPDYTTIEKLNQERYSIKAKIRTEKMKLRETLSTKTI